MHAEIARSLSRIESPAERVEQEVTWAVEAVVMGRSAWVEVRTSIVVAPVPSYLAKYESEYDDGRWPEQAEMLVRLIGSILQQKHETLKSKTYITPESCAAAMAEVVRWTLRTQPGLRSLCKVTPEPT